MSTKKTTKRVAYSEPADYFPKSIRKAHKIGEYAEKKTTAAKKKTVKKSK